MYRLRIPKNNKKVLSIMDSLMVSKSVVIPDVKSSRNIGMYIKTWRKNGFVSMYVESKQKKTLLVSNTDIFKNTKHQKNVEFFIDDSLIRVLSPRTPLL
jgi:hypothetical protein